MEPLPSFSSFWEIYPRREAKQEAVRVWNALNPDDALLATIIASLKTQIGAGKFSTETKFIPLPTTWLNQRRWEDEVGQADAFDPDAAYLDELMRTGGKATRRDIRQTDDDLALEKAMRGE